MRAFTGVSGSGKPSLVFDTIYTEAQQELISHLPAGSAVRVLDVGSSQVGTSFRSVSAGGRRRRARATRAAGHRRRDRRTQPRAAAPPGPGPAEGPAARSSFHSWGRGPLPSRAVRPCRAKRGKQESAHSARNFCRSGRLGEGGREGGRGEGQESWSHDGSTYRPPPVLPYGPYSGRSERGPWRAVRQPGLPSRPSGMTRPA